MGRWRCLTRSRRCCDDCRRRESRSGGSPPNAAATRMPSTTVAQPGPSPCPRSAHWPACRSPPLVCVGGQPSAAGWRLLDLLAAGGAEFRYHGDFDWGGIRIACAVRQRVGQGQSHWQPWRYDRDAYEAAATAVLAVHAATRLPRLAGGPVATPWDPGLAAAMAWHDVRIREELC